MLDGIGPKIKEAREEIKLSQNDLGMALGLSDKAISAYEASRTIPPLETLVRISEELCKPLEYFINPKSSDYNLETKLAALEKTTTKVLTEIQTMRKQLQDDSEKDEDCPQVEKAPTLSDGGMADPKNSDLKNEPSSETSPEDPQSPEHPQSLNSPQSSESHRTPEKSEEPKEQNSPSDPPVQY